MRHDGDPLGSRLLGDEQQSTTGLRRRVQLLLTVSLLAANLVGAAVVSSLALFVIPGPSLLRGRLAIVTVVGLPAYVVVALLGGALVGTVRALRALDWLRADRVPTEREVAAAFAVPARLVAVVGALWLGADVLFTVLYGLASSTNVPRSAFTITLGGIEVCANVYLLAEFALRPVAARALAAHTPVRRGGVRSRTLLAWALGSGIPVVGVMTVAVFSLTRSDISVARLAATVLALGAVTLVFGLLLMLFISRATVAPIRSVVAALSAIADGDLDAEVVVYDGTELGALQTGFNAMAAGLRERELIRDLFGRHVGRSVARAALDGGGPELGGEERTVAVVFVDVVGSTAMAVERPPADVVALLNRFFAVVVDEVEQRGGLVNKFLGDAALAVFGAPVPLDDPAGCALEAAREVLRRLATEVPELGVGAGVSAGIAVAGNVGARERFEYTVIGDPVNSAARLADAAKGHDRPLLASAAALDAASGPERVHWDRDGEQVLRGRGEPTELWRVS